MRLATDKSPKLTVPYRYLFTGIGVLVILSTAIVLKAEAFTVPPYGSTVLLPLTHLLTLGWITMTIVGAMFQLVPVITEKDLYSETIAKMVFYIYLAGIAWLVYSFAVSKPSEIGAGIVSIALILFIIDSFMTMRGMKVADLAVWYVVAGMCFLCLTLLTGSFAAYGMHHIVTYNSFDLLFLHIALAGIGWVCFVVIGFSLRLIPMFILSHGYKESYGWASFVTLIFGLVFVILYFLLHMLIPQIKGIHWIELSGGFLMLIGIISYILQMRIIYKQRTRHHIEPAIWFSICATGYLFVSGVAGVWMIMFRHSFRIDIAYVITGLFGFAGMYIIGMMHKIVPFLQWYNKYSSKIGLEKVPKTKDMINEPLTWIQLFVFNAGLIALLAGVISNMAIIITISGAILLIGSTMFVWNMITVLRR